MSKFAPADKERLMKLLSEKLKIYKQIRKLTEEQTELLIEDDIEAFDGSLDDRAALIEKINGLHQDSNPLMQSYVSHSGNKKSGGDAVEKLKEQIRDVLEICNDLNKKNTEAMELKLKEHSVKIDKQSAKRKGIGGYAQSVPNTPEMFDKKT